MCASPKSPRWDLWPVCIIAFFTLAIAGCASFVVFCNLHPPELVAADYYEQELRYQSQLDRMNRTQALAGQAQIIYEPASRQITLALPVAKSAELPTGKIQLYRPSAAGRDRELPLNTAPDGKQSLDARTLDPGLWRVRVTWNVGTQEYFVDKPVVIDAKGS